MDINAELSPSGKSFILTWAERAGPIVQRPARRSFGSKLIEHAFVAQLQATASLKFDPAGVSYRLEVPLAAVDASISRTRATS